jgi:hypothetical protein
VAITVTDSQRGGDPDSTAPNNTITYSISGGADALRLTLFSVLAPLLARLLG